VRAFGEEIDPEKQELLADVKAVSLHHFSVGKATDGWKATVVIDVLRAPEAASLRGTRPRDELGLCSSEW
jgi:Archease protein family (MTH1598/TM1083)